MFSRISPPPLPLFVSVAALALFSATAGATTRTVTNLLNDGAGSLRAAITNSVSGDTVAVSATGTIVLTSEIRIASNLTIIGPSSGTTIIQASTTRAFNIASGNVNLSNLTISGFKLGTAGGNADGGAIFNSGTLTLTECTVKGSFAAGGSGGGSGRGGAIANSGSLTVVRCTFYGGTALGGDGLGSQTGGTGAGGAIYNTGNLSLINTTIHGCTAKGGQGGPVGGTGGSGLGAAIYNVGTFSATNSTVVSNSATGRNGGLAGNGGDASGGGIFQAAAAGSTMPRNVIFALNTVTPGAAGTGGQLVGTTSGPDAAGAIASQGHNLVGRSDGSSGWIAGDRLGGTTDATRLDPMLTALQDNGGRTLTRRPIAGSPAIEAGDDSAVTGPHNLTDQRGFLRNVGLHVDIGAVEPATTQPGPTFTVTMTGEHNDGVCTNDDCTLLEAVNAANATPGANTINFGPAVTGTITTALTKQGLRITDSVTIKGPGARKLSIHGGGAGRLFYNSASNVSISGLTMRNGAVSKDDGGAIKNTGSLTITDCHISSSNAASPPKGGAASTIIVGRLLRSSVLR